MEFVVLTVAREFGLNPLEVYDYTYAAVLDVFYGVIDLERYDKARAAVLISEEVGGVTVAVRGGDVGKWEESLMGRVGLLPAKADLLERAQRMAAVVDRLPVEGTPEPTN